ncbi:MAG: cytochrome c [Thermoanaerobaculia bacterium]|nr:cytochrome c [Thermoanaerobaculia bacterium]
MKIPLSVKIAGLTVAATAFYTYVGQLVPQKEVHPPEVTELSEEMTTADLVEIGEEIVNGKGLCTTCHTIGQPGAAQRFPDLGGIAERAGDRVEGLSGLEYLAQSLYDPEAFIVPGFSGGMPAVDEPPVGLTDQEIRTVLAYLQTLGGEATITMDSTIPLAGNGTATAAGGAAARSAEASAVAEARETTSETAAVPPGQCGDCHGATDGAAPLEELLAGMDAEEIVGAVAGHPSVEETDFTALTLGETREIAERFRAGGGQ